MTIKKIILFLFIINTIIKSYSQDIISSQYYSNTLNLNPAMCGFTDCDKIILNYRNQWTSIAGYENYSASYNGSFDKISSGIGINIVKDKQSEVFSIFHSDIIYSYKTRLSRNLKGQLALQLSYYQNTFDAYSLVFNNMIHQLDGVVYPMNESIYSSKTDFLDFSSGILLYSRNWFAGFAAHHLSQIQLSGQYHKKTYKLTFHAGGKINLSKKNNECLYIFPNFIFQNQNNNRYANYGAYLMKKNFLLGFWFRQIITSPVSFDAAIIIFGIEFKKVEIGYSYDLTLSKLWRISYGSHEVAIKFRFKCRQKINGKNTISCPAF